jgi:hypothetical protein
MYFLVLFRLLFNSTFINTINTATFHTLRFFTLVESC